MFFFFYNLVMTFSMVNAQRERDSTFSARGFVEDEFERLFYSVMTSVTELNTISEPEHFNRELAKIRNKLRKIIMAYFKTPANQLALNPRYMHDGKKIAKELDKIITILQL